MVKGRASKSWNLEEVFESKTENLESKIENPFENPWPFTADKLQSVIFVS